MVRVVLPTADRARLEEVFRATPEAELRHRVQLVLMAHRGRPHGDIAADIGCSRSSVQRWLNAYLGRGSDGLQPRKAKGGKPKLTPDLAPVGRRRVIGGPAKQGRGRANRTYPELADHLPKTKGLRAGKSALQAFGARDGIRPYRPTYKALRGDPGKQAEARGGDRRPETGAAVGGRALRSQDEARFPMAPTLTAALGVKGRRPVAGTWDNKSPVYAFAVASLVTAAVHANTLESPKGAKKRTGLGRIRRLQAGLAAHLRHVGRAYPRVLPPREVLLSDNAPWHRGTAVDEAMGETPHLEFERPPSDSPHLNPIERFWTKLRRRATHDRLFDTPADLKSSIRASLGYCQTVKGRVKTLLDRRGKK